MIKLTTYFKSYETKTAQKTSLNIYCSNVISKKIIKDMIILRFFLIRIDCELWAQIGQLGAQIDQLGAKMGQHGAQLGHIRAQMGLSWLI